MVDQEKPLEWIASSYKDLMALPPDVRRRFGYALSLAQLGDQVAEAMAQELRNAKTNH
jgi:phage-related protein